MSSFQSNLSLVCLMFVIVYANLAHSTRTRVGKREEDPTTQQIYTNYRIIFGTANHFYLKEADALNEANISKYLLDDQIGADGKFAKFNFKFNSGDYFRRSQTTKWFTTLEERVALQVYDDSKEMDLSSGPQVDQKLCGLHLDYMLHMIDKHQNNIMQSTEFSIFHIMSAFDSPRQGLGQGNAMFLGDYETCKSTKLNVIKKELAKIDKDKAQAYFGSARNHPNDQQLSGAFKFVREYIGPFFGYHAHDSSYISLDAAQDKLRPLPMRYCLAGLRWPVWSNSSWSRRHIVMRTATCLPETCDSKSLSLHYDKIKKLTEFQMNSYHSGFYIENLYCLPDEQSPFRDPLRYTSTKLFLAFNAVWFALLISVTIAYHLMQRRGTLNKLEGLDTPIWWLYLRSWCITKNFRDFLAIKSNEIGNNREEKQLPKKQKLNLDPLEGLKVLSSLTVIASHTIMVVFPTSWNPSASHPNLARTWLAMVNTIYPSTVNIFFVITGITTARLLIRISQKCFLNAGFWVKFFILRYIRIIPLYFLFHWFLQSTFRFLSSGPLWDYGTSHSAWSRGCQDDSPWGIIIPQANYISPSVHCNGVGWYLANDLHFVLLTPFYLTLLWMKPLLGHTLAIVSVLAGMINHVFYYYYNDPEPRGLLEWNCMVLTRVTDDTMTGYVYPRYRFISYVIGLSAGHLLELYERDVIKQWPRALTVYGKWTMYAITYFLCFLPYISSLWLDLDDSTIRIVASLVQGTAHGLSSLAIAIFVMLLTTGYYPKMSHFMGANLFKPIANMSLSTVLVHLPILFYHTHSLTSLPELRMYEFFKTALVWIIETLVISVLIHVLYELPLRRLCIKSLLNIFAGKPESKDIHQRPTLKDQKKAKSKSN